LECTDRRIDITCGPEWPFESSNGFWLVWGGTTGVTFRAESHIHIDGVRLDGSSAGRFSDREATSSCIPWLTVANHHQLAINFAENRTTTGTPEWWLAQSGWTNDFEAAAMADPDGDSFPNWKEYVAGTDPTNPTAYVLPRDADRPDLRHQFYDQHLDQHGLAVRCRHREGV